MGTMLTTARNVSQLHDLVVLVITISVLAAIKSCGDRTTIHDDVQTVERTKHPLGTRHQRAVEANLQWFNLGGILASQWRWGYPKQTFIPLVAVVKQTHEPRISLGTVKSRST